MSDVVLSVKNISKLYPGVTALDKVSLDFKMGEVHALLGENGAGKSTLIKIIAGAVIPEEGEITIDGQTYKELNPHLAKDCGVEVIYQEFNLFDTLTVAENICFGEKDGRLVNYKTMQEKTKQIFAEMGIEMDVNQKVYNLPTAQKQLVEIGKSISRDAKVLIMDEPSAPLSVSEIEKMFDIIRKLKSKGVTIIYISHRMDEIFEIADRVSVLRDGQYIDTKSTKETTIGELIKLMVGRSLNQIYPEKTCSIGKKVLEVKNYTGNGDHDISFDLREGEILGLAGLVGAGRTELARLIFGADKKDGGELYVDGKKIDIRLPSDAIKNGIGLIPEDRKLQGCFLSKEVFWNCSIASIKKISKNLVVNTNKEIDQANHYTHVLDIKTPSIFQRVKNLSGGNQQKVVIAKTLAANSKVLIFDEPTRGIDVGAKQEIYNLMVELANEGKAIIMITSEMPELLGMSDRIIVLYEGRTAGELGREEFNQDRVLELASGIL